MTEFAIFDDQKIAYDITGDGLPVLLLRGFPQNKPMWHRVFPILAHDFTVVTADQLALMRHLGFSQFHLVGHDRGARTTHRLALDAPDALYAYRES